MRIDSRSILFAQRQVRKQIFQKVIICLLILLLVLQLVFIFFIRPVNISSSSMQPEFSKGSAVFVVPTNFLFFDVKNIPRGSIVQYDNLSLEKKSGFQSFVDFVVGMLSFQKIKPFESSEWANSEVYRLIGLPGDTIYIDNYIAHIKEGGSAHFLTEFELSPIEYDVITTGYPRNWDMRIGSKGKTDEITLRNGEYFLLSDNRILALDSRVFGSIKEENITTKVFAQYFPFSNIRVLD